MHEIINETNIATSVDHSIDELENDIDEYIRNKSGWVFHSNIKNHVNVYQYIPIKGSSFIELPTVIANKKTCINIKNNNEKCFLYCCCS